MKLKEILQEKGMTAYALQKQTGLPETTIRDLVNGKSEFAKTPLKNALAIALVLDMDVEDLFIEIYEQPIEPKRRKIQDFIYFIVDLLAIEMVEVSFQSLENDAVATSYPVERKIHINPAHKLDEFELYIVLTHELRHQFQYDACSVPDSKKAKYEELEVIEKWQFEFDNYKRFNEDGYSEQAVEVDAECFAHWIMMILFGVSSQGYQPDNPIFVKRLKEIASDFTKEEIEKVLKQNNSSFKLKEIKKMKLEIKGNTVFFNERTLLLDADVLSIYTDKSIYDNCDEAIEECREDYKEELIEFVGSNDYDVDSLEDVLLVIMINASAYINDAF